MLSTAPAGGGIAGDTTRDENTGSGWLKVLDSSIVSSLINLSDNFWSSCSSLMSVVSLIVLAGDFFTEPLSEDKLPFLSLVLLLDSTFFLLFLI